jgi:glucose/arabinose dehydrogenase
LSFRSLRLGAALAAAVALIPAAASAQGPPPPTAASGAAVTTVAAGAGTPTSFARMGEHLFLGAAPGEGQPSAPGGIHVLRDGQFTKVEGAPELVFGLAAADDVLYVSAGKEILALSGFDGTRFASSKTVYRGPSTFPGFNGLAIGRDGRLIAGVQLDARFDGKKNPHPNTQAVVSMTTKGKDLQIIAEGLRQPWQFTFLGKSRWPLVSELALDVDPAPKDTIVLAKPGSDYGYPTCRPGEPKTCKGFTKPRITLPVHSSPMGLASKGKRLYVALFGGIGDSGPEVVSMSGKGKGIRPVLTGFVAPVVALAIDGRTLYAGDVTGSVYATPLG